MIIPRYANIGGRIVGVLSTEQFVGIKVGDICPRHHIYVVKENAALSDDV